MYTAALNLLGDNPKFANKKVYMRRNSVCMKNAQKHKTQTQVGALSPYSFGYVYVPDWSLRKR